MEYTEEEIRTAALAALRAAPGGSMTTSQLIDALTVKMAPSGRDADIAEGRSDTYFSQKVRNLVSHRDQGTGLVARGLITYEKASERLTITGLGRHHV